MLFLTGQMINLNLWELWEHQRSLIEKCTCFFFFFATVAALKESNFEFWLEVERSRFLSLIASNNAISEGWENKL